MSLAALLLIPLGEMASCRKSVSKFELRSGLVSVEEVGGRPRLMLVREMDRLKLDPTPGVGFGFEISSVEADETFRVYSVHYPPNELGTVGDMFVGRAPDGGYITREESVRRSQLFSFGFDEGDPLGVYRVDVYANGELVGEIRFTLHD